MTPLIADIMLASNVVDRAAHLRTDAAAQEALRADPRAFVIWANDGRLAARAGTLHTTPAAARPALRVDRRWPR